MKSLRRMLALCTLLNLALAPAAWGAREEDYTLQCRSGDRVLEVYAAHRVDPARCAAIAARVMKAFAFVAESAAWRDRSLLTARPLQFALVGEDAINVLGYAKGPNLMVMKDSYLDKPLSEGTLAHELAHILDFRQLRGKRMPSFMFEGRALTIGYAYRMHVGQPPGDYDRQMTRSAEAFAESFAEFLRTTQGDPQRRLQGTIWQSVGTSAAAAPQDAYVSDVIDLVGELLK